MNRPLPQTALIFGAGYLGARFAVALKQRGWRVLATAREPHRREALGEMGLEPVDPADAGALHTALLEASAVLVTAAPDPVGCPALRLLGPRFGSQDRRPDWLGYVSSTGVYGDRGGKWVDERSDLNAPTVQGARRAAAERDWLSLARECGMTVCLFRLPAIYGPGRTPFERLREGSARIVRKPGQVFNRVHVDDAVSAMLASLDRPRAGRAYNLCDDEPAGMDAYVEFAAGLIGLPPPPEVALDDPEVSDAMRRFYLDNKRVSNARAKAELGWRPRYASWRDGLNALAADLQGPVAPN